MTVVWHAEPGQGPALKPSLADLFSYGFRPFFLGTAAYAAILMCVWLMFIVATHTGGDGSWLAVPGSPFAWHAHEFAMGFAAAAVGGFLLTAVPNWTGAMPLAGVSLAVVFSLWVLGRIAMLSAAFLPPPLVALADMAFIPVLAAVAVRQLMVKPAMRNLVLVVLLALITLANASYHAAVLGWLEVNPLASMRAVILVVVVMITMIGGRIIPAFTHNWLNVRRHTGAMPRRNARLDAASVMSVALFAGIEAIAPQSLLSGTLAVVAAGLNGMRLQGWRGWAARSEPIVWILHVGYGWLIVGLCLEAASSLLGTITPSLGYHAFGAGAAGTMILAVMTRASLGHTGRKLLAPPLAVWSYWLISASALMRVAVPLLVANESVIGIGLTLAALAWIGAFVLFVIAYAPILTTPRVRTKLAA